MRSKLKIITLAFILFAIVLVPSCFAATVLESTEDYAEGAIIYGSTRFEMDQIITAGVAFNAGINESKVWVALGNKLNDLEAVTPYYYDGASWYKITTDSVEILSDAAAQEVEESLHIFFVNNEMKTVEVPYDGNVDEGSVTDGAKYDKTNKKFLVPALSFDFSFTDDGAKVEVNTNVDTNTEITNPEDAKDTEIVNKEVAIIGDVKYEFLAKAFEAAEAGATIKLIANVDIPTAVKVDKKVTLDLNGKTITAKNDPNGDGLFMVVAGGDLTINGEGKLDAACQTNDYSMAIWAKETGKVTINGGTYTNVGAKSVDGDGETNNNEVIYARDNAEITINGGTFIGNTANEKYGPKFTLNLRDQDKATAKIIVKGGTFTGFNPASNDADKLTGETENTNYVAEGYKVVVDGDKYTVKAYDANNVTDENELRYFMLNGGTIKLGADIEIGSMLNVKKDLVLDLNGKIIKAADTLKENTLIVAWNDVKLTIKGNGTINSATQANLSSIAVWSYSADVTIENGIFTNLGAKSLGEDGETANNEVIYVSGTGKVTINGGTFIGNSENKANGVKFTLNSQDTDYKNGKTKIIVKGGTFTGFNPADNAAEGEGTNFVAEGYKVTVDGDKYTVIARDPANNVSNEEDLRYHMLNGGKVTLGADIKLNTNKTIGLEKDLVLDLNGHTISVFEGYTKNNVMWTSANLTITGNGTIDARMNDHEYTYALYAWNGGNITIENGNFIGIHGLEDYECSLIYCQGAGSLITILDGTFVGDDTFTLNVSDAHYEAGTANIVVKGGTFTGFNPADNKAEGEGTNFVAEGYKVVKNGNKYTVKAYDANNVTDENELRYFMLNGGTIKLGADIEVGSMLNVKKDLVLDLNGKTIKAADTLKENTLIVAWNDVKLTIKGNGTINSATQANLSSIAVWSYSADVTIENGTFTNLGAKSLGEDGETANNEVIYVSGTGKVTINGGTFIGNSENKANGVKFTLNSQDTDYKNGKTKIIVKGGTFAGFNPADNAAEGEGTNFLAAGYGVAYNEATNTYTVAPIEE